MSPPVIWFPQNTDVLPADRTHAPAVVVAEKKHPYTTAAALDVVSALDAELAAVFVNRHRNNTTAGAAIVTLTSPLAVVTAPVNTIFSNAW
jgi:hypothetical protein